MSSGALSRRYARALLELGKDAGQIDPFAADLAAFSAAMAAGGGMLSGALLNPGLTTAERRAVMDAVLEKMALSPMVTNFLRLLVDKNRLMLFADIGEAYQAMADVEAGRVRATVTTAAALDAAAAQQIKAVLERSTGKSVLVDYQVDPELIGGVVARVGDTVYDASIRARLREMKETLAR